jgi:hypothetical protein
MVLKMGHFGTYIINILLYVFKMWCWRIMEKINWTDRVKNEEILQRVEEEGTPCR